MAQTLAQQQAQASVWRHRQGRRCRLLMRCSAASFAEGPERQHDAPSSSGDNKPWWTTLNRKTGIQGPNDFKLSEPSFDVAAGGSPLARRMEQLEKEERQRVWDNMRAVAAERHAAGLMPAWFDPSMIRQEEEPLNRMFREAGRPGYQSDDTWVGPPPGHQQPTTDSGGSDGRAAGRGGGGGGWWRPEDPYWPLRDWGDHPMRWWAFGLAAVLAVGGSGTFLLSGGRAAEALLVGCGCGSLLALAAMAMSDAASLPGALGVKLAWAICVLLFAKDAWWGWQHKRRRTLAASQPSMGLCGAAALALAAGLMLTDMSALGEVALPDNPGAVFKSPDVAYRNSVWSKWGYGQVQMRL